MEGGWGARAGGEERQEERMGTRQACVGGWKGKAGRVETRSEVRREAERDDEGQGGGVGEEAGRREGFKETEPRKV